MKIIEVAGAVIERDGKFLILLRNENKPQPLTWGLPSGKVEDCETTLETIRRETFEETGGNFDPQKFVHIYTARYDFSADGYMTNYHVYKIEVDSNFESLIKLDEHNEHRWVTPEEALGMDNLIGGLDDVIRRVYSIGEYENIDEITNQ